MQNALAKTTPDVFLNSLRYPCPFEILAEAINTLKSHPFMRNQEMKYTHNADA
jgi:hypothetical protein